MPDSIVKKILKQVKILWNLFLPILFPEIRTFPEDGYLKVYYETHGERWARGAIPNLSWNINQ